MDETPEQIMNHIELQRDELGRNLGELESRVKRSTDWRAQFDRNPMLMIGVAMGGGLLIGTVVSGRRSRTTKTAWSSSPEGFPAPEVEELTFLRDQNQQLIKLVAELKTENRRLKKKLG